MGNCQEQEAETELAKTKAYPIPFSTLSEFFPNLPPNSARQIRALAEKVAITNLKNGWGIKYPSFQMFCPTESDCDRVSYFDALPSSQAFPNDALHQHNFFVRYICRNCRRCQKIYAIQVGPFTELKDGKTADGQILKLGESPILTPKAPPKLRRILGSDYETFMQGMRSESYGFGIGAFAYFRRVVENIKGRLFDEIIKVAKLLHDDGKLIRELEDAKTERQFSKAVDKIKTALPQTLLFQGHNPLLLLHDALSEDLHGGTDAECLEIAQTIRLVLTDLCERINVVQRENKQLEAGIHSLLEKTRLKSPKKKVPVAVPEVPMVGSDPDKQT